MQRVERTLETEYGIEKRGSTQGQSILEWDERGRCIGE